MKLFKKILCGVLSATMLITSAAIPTMAADDITVKLDGKTLSFDVPPQIINDRTMVPLRAIFEALGASVDWNQETKTVTSTKDDTTIKLTVDSDIMYVNDNAVTLDTPACVVNDRTLVPVRAISEAYKTKVDWDGETRTVVITSNVVSPTVPTEFKGTHNIDSYPGVCLMQAIKNNGYYIQERNTYAVLEQLDDTNDIFLSCKMKDDKTGMPESICLILTTIKSNYTSQTTLIINESPEPSAMTTLKSKYGESVLGGSFSPSDGKFYKTYGDVHKSLEQDAIDVINNAVGFFDYYLQIKDYGVTLSDFGVVYTSESNSSVSSSTEQPQNTLSTEGLPELTQNDISIKLKIPTNGGYNWYAEIEVQNNSNATITFPGMAGLNGSLVQTNPTMGSSKEIDVKSGESKKLSYYTSMSKKDMYLDNNSIGYFVIEYNGTQYYVEYGINGITTFYKGNVNGPA